MSKSNFNLIITYLYIYHVMFTLCTKLYVEVKIQTGGIKIYVCMHNIGEYIP